METSPFDILLKKVNIIIFKNFNFLKILIKTLFSTTRYKQMITLSISEAEDNYINIYYCYHFFFEFYFHFDSFCFSHSTLKHKMDTMNH